MPISNTGMKSANIFIMFAGSFKQMPFSEVVRLLSSSHQSGALNIVETGGEVVVGQLFIQMGQLVDATQGNHSGLDALQELCRWIDADFSFDATSEAQRKTLVAYPTEKLIEKIKARTDELTAIRDSMPQEHDIPLYQSGMDASALNVTPDELSLLLQCSGTQTVQQIAESTGQDAQLITRVLARFRHAGIIILQELPASPAPADLVPEASPEVSADKKKVRYWRGHKVE
jgi:predicted transcriptional regulator